MKTTLSTYDIAGALMNDTNANWSRAGAYALAEWLEEIDDSTGQDTELDVVALRCDFSEYGSLQEWANDYFAVWKTDLPIQDGATDEEIDEQIREFIIDNGCLIEFDGGIIVSSF